MTTLTRALLIAALSAPLATSAQNAPSGTGTTGTAKSGHTPKTSSTDTGKKEKVTAKLSEDELQIMSHYHKDNLAELDLGRHAMKNGKSQAVKSYGETLVKDHGDFDKRLLALAKKTGQTIPEEKLKTDAERQEHANVAKTAADLKKLTGANLDREYLRFMVEHHHHILANIDAHIAQARNTELASMLTEVKPVLQRHHDRARELQQKETQAMK